MKLIKFLLVCIFIFATELCRAIEIDFETDSTLPLVSINLLIKAGAINDPPTQLGLTDFMGEMLLRGTLSHSKSEIDFALDQMGAKLEVETRAEAMILRGAVLSKNLKSFLNLFTEVVTQPQFSEAELKNFRRDRISELKNELGNDAALTSKKFTEFLFRGHPYGNPIEGRIKDLSTIRRQNLVDHYNCLVQEQFFVALGSGDAPELDIHTWGQELARLRPRHGVTPCNQSPVVPLPAPVDSPSQRVLLIDKPERTQTQIYLGQIGIKMDHSDFYALHLANHAFGGQSFSAILMDEIRTKRGWSYGANSTFRYGTKPRSWSVHLFPSSQDTPAALTHTLTLIRNLKEQGLTQSQFDFSKNSMLQSEGFTYNTPAKRVENKVIERTLNLPTGSIQSMGSHIKNLTRSETNAALSQFLKPDALTITVLGTAKKLRSPLSDALGIKLKNVYVQSYLKDENP